MGKKTKTGKNRLDKFYRMAKDQGYRSRASFKLVQLNRKFNFLARAQVVIDLCAAPGSWLQVCSKYMPASRVLIGVDLDPIKGIPGAVTLMEDITTAKCRLEIERCLCGQTADVVLHDGAPNVGGAWAHDAYSQSELVLSAVKLATCFLAKGGTFVTKVFRSSDYNNLLWVFNTLFRKVTATKPVASRNTSAEIFVVCEQYIKPTKIDPKLLDPKFVFKEFEEIAPVNVLAKKQPRRNREGYNTDSILLFKECDILDFVHAEDPVKILSSFSRILFKPCNPVPYVDRDRDEEDDKEERSLFEQHPKTTEEIIESFDDLKVLGQKAFRTLIRWRAKMREFSLGNEKEEKKKEYAEHNKVELTEEQKENLLEQEIEDKIRKFNRSKKKKLNKKRKQQTKFQMRIGINSNMQDESFDAPSEKLLFDLGSMKSKTGLEAFSGKASVPNEEELAEMEDEDIDFGDQETIKREAALMQESYALLESEHQANKSSDSDSEYSYEDEDMDEGVDASRDRKVEQQLDIMYQRLLNRREANIRFSKTQRRLSEKKKGESTDLLDFSSFAGNKYEGEYSTDEDEPNELVSKHVTPRDVKSAMWFNDELFEGVETEQDSNKAINLMLHQKRLAKKRKLEAQALDNENEPVNNKKRKIEAEKDELDDTLSKFGEALGLGIVPYEPRIKKPVQNINAKEGEADFEIVPRDFESESEDEVEVEEDQEIPGSKFDPDDYDSDEQAEMLAMGKALKDPKSRAKLIEHSWNRYAFDDGGGLPQWFVDDESRHSTAQIPITKEEVEEHKRMIKEIDARAPNKVAEARARKKRQYVAKLEKAKKRAKNISNSDMSEREKIKSIQKLYKGQLKTQKKDKVYVVAKRSGNARVTGQKNVKIKAVDPRMKCEKRAAKARDNKKKKRGRK